MEKNFMEARAFLADPGEKPFIRVEPLKHKANNGKWITDVQITIEKGENSVEIVMPFIHCKHLAAGLEKYLLAGPGDPDIVVVRDGEIEIPQAAQPAKSDAGEALLSKVQGLVSQLSGQASKKE